METRVFLIAGTCVYDITYYIFIEHVLLDYPVALLLITILGAGLKNDSLTPD